MKYWWWTDLCSFLVLHFAVFFFIFLNNIITFIALKMHFFSTGLSGSWWEPWIICLIWDRPGLVSRLPDTVWTCCGGLLMIVFRITLTVVLLHSATLQMEILAFIDFKIGTDFFLTVTYYTMRWATCKTLVHCLIMWQKVIFRQQQHRSHHCFLYLRLEEVWEHLCDTALRSGELWSESHLPH